MSKRSPAPLREVSRARIEELNIQRKDPALYAPVPTGIFELDRLIGGLPKSDAWIGVVLAPKKIGKTTLAMALAHQWCLRTGKKAIYFGLEELRFQFADRMLADLADINRRNIFMRKLDEDDIANMERSIFKMSENLYVQDDTFTVDQAVKEMGDKFDLAIFDNLQLHERDGRGSDREQLEKIGRRFVHYRNERRKSFMVVAQESDAGRSHGSDEILRGMDFGFRLCEVYEEIVNEKGKKEKGDPIEWEREIEVLRSRNMASGRIRIAFDGKHNRIGNPGGIPLGGTNEFDLKRFQALVDGKQVVA